MPFDFDDNATADEKDEIGRAYARAHTKANWDRLTPEQQAEARSPKNIDNLKSLLHLAMIFVSAESEVFTKEQVIEKTRELAGEECPIEEQDLRIVLDGSRLLKKVKGGWRQR